VNHRPLAGGVATQIFIAQLGKVIATVRSQEPKLLAQLARRTPATSRAKNHKPMRAGERAEEIRGLVYAAATRRVSPMSVKARPWRYHPGRQQWRHGRCIQFCFGRPLWPVPGVGSGCVCPGVVPCSCC
jgi:hypothetical protein